MLSGGDLLRNSNNSMTIDFCRINESWLAQHGLTAEALSSTIGALVEENLQGETACTIQQVTGVLLFFKTYRLRRGRDKLRTLLGRSEAQRAYNNAFRLQKRGITCPEAVALVGVRRALMVLVNEALTDGEILLGCFCRLLRHQVPSPPLTALFEQLADFLLQLHTAGIYHSDLHDTNIWVKQHDDKFTFKLVDLEAVRLQPLIVSHQRQKNLLRLCRNLGTAAEIVGLDGKPLALEFANYYFKAAHWTVTEQSLELVEDAAVRGMERWRELHP